MQSAGILFALISTLSFGLLRIPQQMLIKNVGVQRALFYVYLVEISILILLSPLFSSFVVVTASVLPLILITGILGAAAIASLFKAVEKGHVSVMSTLSQTFVIITLFISVFFLNEQPTQTQYVGVAATLIGAALASFKKKDLLTLNLRNALPGTHFALLTALIWGVFYVLYDMIVARIGAFPAALWTEGAIFITVVFSTARQIQRPDYKLIKYAIITGILLVSGVIALNKSFELIQLSVVTPILAASPIVTALAARVLLKETLEINQYGGIAVAVLGVVLVST